MAHQPSVIAYVYGHRLCRCDTGDITRTHTYVFEFKRPAFTLYTLVYILYLTESHYYDRIALRVFRVQPHTAQNKPGSLMSALHRAQNHQRPWRRPHI